MRPIRLIVVSVYVLAARPLHAQAAADTSRAFRGGQWGVEFIPSRSLAEGGVLRFSTPTLAWVLDGAVAYDHQSTTCDCAPDQSFYQFNANARVGARWYHSEYERVVRFIGLGVTGSYLSDGQSFSGTSSQESWSAGVYGEFGLQYLFTRHLGLGVRGDVIGTRSLDHSTQPLQVGSATVYHTVYHLALDPLQIIGAFYF